MAEPLISTALARYIAEHTSGDDVLLRELKAAAGLAGIPAIWIAPEQASFLQIVLRLCGAREVVEVGTLAGYSAIVLARVLPADGRLRTIEISAAHASFAREWIARAGVAARVEVLEGSGRERLAEMADGSLDALFIDADKAGYAAYLEEARRLLRRGGVVLVDNALAFGQLLDDEPGDPDVPSLRSFNDHLARSGDFHSVIVPLGDGCWLGIRR